MVRRLSVLAALAAATAAALLGSSAAPAPRAAPAHAPVLTYSPAARGDVVKGRQQCYFVLNMAETVLDWGTGLCPAATDDTEMPLEWHEEYDAYYASTAYTGTFVPTPLLPDYLARERQFQAAHRQDIAAQSARAVYRASDGTIVHGTSPTMVFSNGLSPSICVRWEAVPQPDGQPLRYEYLEGRVTYADTVNGLCRIFSFGA